jgi:hypothetical protein
LVRIILLTKQEEKMRVLILTVLVLGLTVGVAFAVPQTDNVVVNNQGNAGYIFTSTGTSQGNNQIGTWTDSSSLKGEKGDKGDTGATGQAGQDGVNGLDGKDGQQGVAGNDGQNGLDGQDGKTPVKGEDYNDGKDGEQGINGEDGKDVDPATVENLQNSINQNTTETNKLNDRVNELEETQNIIGGVLRIKDTKKWTIDLFVDYSTDRQIVDRQGIRFTYKMGESYQDKENKRLEARIQALENK